MVDENAGLQHVKRLAEQVRAADAKANGLREQLRHELDVARDAGVTISALARALGVSRQRVQQMIRR